MTIEAAAPILAKALDGLFLRQMVTAQNIANAGSPHYTPLKVSFEGALQQAASTSRAAVESLQPQISEASDHTQNGEMRLDLELTNAIGTTGRYNALLTVVDRQARLMGIAITGGA